MGRWGHDWNGFDPTTLASPETLRKMRKARRERARNDDAAPAHHVEPETMVTVTSTMLKEIIWEALVEDTRMSIVEIQDVIESKTGKRTGSIVLIGNLQSEFRMILKFLKARGLLNRKIKI